jgi:hypothetical protein
MSWHVDEATAHRYASRRIDPVQAASVESHVMACAGCRDRVGNAVEGPVLGAVWAALTEELDEPRLGIVERALVRLGCSEANARIIAATSRARWSYLLAVGLSLLLAAIAARTPTDEYFGAFLIVAPLGPLIAVAGVFGRWTDALYEVARTAPTPALRILLVRTVAAVAPALLLTMLSIPWLLENGWLAAAWLLPALALTLGTLALSSWLPIETAAIVVGASWVGALLTPRMLVPELLDLFAGPVQLVALAVAVASVAVTALRRSSYDYREA